MANTIHRDNATRAWGFWHRDQIFEEATADVVDRDLWVVKTGDLVFEPPYMLYIVAAVDSDTRYPTLERIDPSKGMSDLISDPDSINDGLRTYQPHISQRLFVDNDGSTHGCRVDARLRIYEPNGKYCRFVLGHDTSSKANVISQSKSSPEGPFTDKVELYNIFTDTENVKRPVDFTNTATLSDNDVVTMIVYNDNDKPVGFYRFIVTLTKNIIGATASSVYVESIELISPLLSPFEENVIEIPYGTSLQTSLLRCRVNFSNGLSKDIDVDGVKAKIIGLDRFNVKYGLDQPIMLVYTLGVGEQAINVHPGTMVIPKEYVVRSVRQDEADLAYRIWLLPHRAETGYGWSAYLTDSLYSAPIDVTEHTVIMQTNGLPFNGELFEMAQTLNLSINLGDVDYDKWGDQRHSQLMSVILDNPTEAGGWLLDYVSDGNNLFDAREPVMVSTTGDRIFHINRSLRNKEEWLTAVFRSLDPLFDGMLLSDVPTPTHFELKHGDLTIGQYPTEEYASPKYLGEDHNWDTSKPLEIVFKTVTPTTTKVLGMGAFPIALH